MARVPTTATSAAQRAFTIIEVVIALVILLGALTATSTLMSGNSSRVIRSRVNSTAAVLLERKMIEIQKEMNAKSISEIPDELSGAFADSPEYKWEFKSKRFEMPDVRSALVADRDGASEYVMQLFGLLKEHFDQVIREGTVTVLYSSGKKQQRFSASMYFVDHGVPISIPGAAQ